MRAPTSPRRDDVLRLAVPVAFLLLHGVLLVVGPSWASTLMNVAACLLAVLAAEQGGQVTAADINPRAVAFAAFNAALNGLDNIGLTLEKDKSITTYEDKSAQSRPWL